MRMRMLLVVGMSQERRTHCFQWDRIHPGTQMSQGKVVMVLVVVIKVLLEVVVKLDGFPEMGGQPVPRGRVVSATKLSGGPANEDIFRSDRVQHPVIAFPWIIIVSSHFVETFVQAQVMPSGGKEEM